MSSLSSSYGARQVLRFGLLLAVLLVVPPARGESGLAVNHYRAGASYFKQGKYPDALREFKESYRLSKKVDLLYNLGQVYERMNKMAMAIKTYERYLKKTKRKEPALRERLANLKATLAGTSITITCNVDGATVLVDDKVVGKTPLSGPIKVKPGSHKIKLRKEGHPSYSAFVAVSAGTSVAVKAELEGGPKTPATKSGGATKGDGAPKADAPPAPASPTPAAPGSSRRLWTWIALGGGAALLAVAGISGASALSKADEADDAESDAAKSARGLAAVADVALVAGIAAVGTGVYLLLTQKSSSERAQAEGQRFAIIPALSPNGASLGAVIRF